MIYFQNVINETKYDYKLKFGRYVKQKKNTDV